MMAQKLLSRLIPLSELLSHDGLFPLDGGFVFGMGFLCFGLQCCFLFLFHVLVVLFVPSLPWDYLQVHNRSFLWLSQFDGLACNLSIQFLAGTNLLNDLASHEGVGRKKYRRRTTETQRGERRPKGRKQLHEAAYQITSV